MNDFGGYNFDDSYEFSDDESNDSVKKVEKEKKEPRKKVIIPRFLVMKFIHLIILIVKIISNIFQKS